MLLLKFRNNQYITAPQTLMKKFVCCGFIALCASSSTAGELTANLGVDADWIEQTVDVENTGENIDSSNQIIKPYARLLYSARDLTFSLYGTQNHVRRQLEDENFTQNYLTFGYAGSYDIIENLLLLNIAGSQGYRSEGVNTLLVDNFLLNADQLNKTKSNQASLSLSLPRGDYFGLSASTAYTKTDSSGNSSNTSSADSLFQNESYGANFSAISGEKLNGVRISLSGSTNYSKRASRQDFVSQSLNLSNNIKVYKQLGFVVNGTYENNEFKTDEDRNADRLREFYSVGAGLSWQASIDKSIEIAWNRSFNEATIEGEEKEENTFLSYNLDWAFSERTKVSGVFTRRFYGEASNFSLSHNLRNWQTSIRYNESVTSSSQLLANDNLGLFICNPGSVSIADCTLSNTLTPELEPGQILQPVIFQNFELNDRIVLNKILTAQTAVTRRRTTVSVIATKANIEEIEISRITDTTSMRFSVSFDITQNSNLEFSHDYSKVESEVDGILQNQLIREESVEFTKQLTRRFSASVGLRYLDREGDLNRGNFGFAGLNGPLTDTRITFRVSYQFGNR